MRSTLRRVIPYTVGIGFVGALGVAGWLGIPALVVGTGYKAKVLCSGLFVSKRTAASVLTDLQTDDLSILRYIDASIDTVRQTVTTRILGIERRAVFREALGCALELDNLTPPALPGIDRDSTIPARSTDREGLTAADTTVGDDRNARLRSDLP